MAIAPSLALPQTIETNWLNSKVTPPSAIGRERIGSFIAVSFSNQVQGSAIIRFFKRSAADANLR